MFRNLRLKVLAICSLEVVLLLGITITTFAGGADEQGLTLGTELDMLPYISGGHYISGVIGYDHYNIRLINTKTTVPGFAAPKGYKNWDMDVNAVIVDYFPDENREGFWFGGGIEFWDSKIQNKTTGDSGKFSQKILTFGCGYVYPMTEHWYINPWAALHYNLSDDRVAIGTDNMKLQDVMYEASLKIGYRF